MTYNNNIPQATDNLSTSQPQILTNFSVLDSTFAVNHYGFSTTPNLGKHKYVVMPVSTQPITAATNEGAIFTKTVGSFTQLFWQPQNYNPPGSTPAAVQLTAGDNTNSAFAAFLNNYNPGGGAVGTAYSAGWSYLPGGILLQYGLYDAGVGGVGSSGIIKFPIPYTNPPWAVFPVFISKSLGTGNVQTVSVISGTINANQFQWNSTSATSAYTGIYWWAVGI